MSEEKISYRSKRLPPREIAVLKEIEEMLGEELSFEEEVSFSLRGVVLEDEHVVGLGLFECKLPRLLENIDHLSNLKYLNYNLNKLRELPPSLGNLAKLEELWLYDNLLTEIPTFIGNLHTLQKLMLALNNIKKLPDSLKELENIVLINTNDNPLDDHAESVLREIDKREDVDVSI